jgi:peptidoglycan/xylan/chitin deacetylase (PgdA/CDA1 family)
MKGVFTISLDFELHWGGFEKWPLRGTGNEVQGTGYKERGTRYGVQGTRNGVVSTDENGKFINGAKDYNQYFLNTRKAIPEMLGLFEKHEVHVTWATVGMLFHGSRAELLENAPALKPAYDAKELSAYNYINDNGIGVSESGDPFHFAPSLIKKIISASHQELGTHTFAHYYCNEAGQAIEQFREDIKAARRAAAKFGKQLKSLVFPRNQFNDQYLKVCFEEGITSVRSNPPDWFWHIESTQAESAWKRLNRGLDAYFPIGKKNTYKLDSIQVRDGLPLCLPASRLLRPYRPKESFLNAMKISRIKSEMTRAAKQGEVYHLWWHPHNFGWYPKESMEGLEKILRHYEDCRERFGMESRSMGEMAEMVIGR